MDASIIEQRFTYHPPKGDQTERYQLIREKAKEFAKLVLEITPESREQTLGLNQLDTAVMLFNAAIARNE